MSEDTSQNTPSGDDFSKMLAEVPEELRTDPSLQSIKDLPSLVKSYVNAQRLVGRKGVILPTEGPDTAPEEWATVWQAVGRPEKPEEYKFPEVRLEEDFERELRSVLHANGVSQRAAFELLQWYGKKAAEYEVLAENEVTENKKQTEELLAKTYGTPERIDAARKAASRVVAMFLPAEMKEGFDGSPVANDPRVLVMLARIAQRFAEDRMFGDAPAPVLTRDEAQRKVDQLRNDPNFARTIWDRQHPDHMKNTQQWEELIKAAVGE